MPKSKLVSFYIGKELKAWLKEFSKDNGLSQGEIARYCLKILRKVTLDEEQKKEVISKIKASS